MNFAPNRRRRMWKYVSPQRRRNGLIFLALLVTLVYAGWYFTNDSRIRREAKRALEGLVSADVDVDTAKFSFFEGIRLYGVRVRIREDDSPYHFFTAQEVVLKFRPWSLFFRQRLELTEIVCVAPVVTIEHDQDTKTSNVQRLFTSSRPQGQRLGSPAVLPEISLTGGKLRTLIKSRGVRSAPTEERFNCTMTPNNSVEYIVTVGKPSAGQNQKPKWFKFLYNVSTGKVTPLSGAMSEQVFDFLPPRYQKWLKQYKLTGEFRIARRTSKDRQEERFEIQLNDLSLQLPPQEGGLSLSNVRGSLIFDKAGITMKGITGKVNEAGKAPFTLSGQYDGYEKQSPFKVTIAIKNVSLPEKVTGPVEESVAFIRRKFKPHGQADITLTYQRDKQGKHHCDGLVTPRAMRMTLIDFPLPVQDVKGEIRFDQTGINKMALTARRGKAKYKVTGKLWDSPSRKGYDIFVQGRGVCFEKALRDAIPEGHDGIWAKFQPSGTTDADVRVFKADRGKPTKVEIDLNMKGFAEMAYRGFPYPLKHLSGRISYRDDKIVISSVQSERGDMRCRFKGEVTGLSTDEPKVNLSITANRIPMDKTFLAAFPEPSRKFVTSLQPAGTIHHMKAEITKSGKEPLKYSVVITLKDASFSHKKFPYKMTNAAGRLTIAQQKIGIHELRGRHGKAMLQLDGAVALAGKDVVYDLKFQATGVAMDKDFRSALPADVAQMWDSLSPKGTADMSLWVKTPKAVKTKSPKVAKAESPNPVAAGPLDYRLVILPREMTIRYKDFPYTFRGITGEVEIRRGRVKLKGLRAGHKKMRACISGEIVSSDEKGQTATLKVNVKGLAVDKEFLAAIPPDVLPLAKRFQPGGSCDVNISELTFRRAPVAKKKPAAKSAAKPAGKSSEKSAVAKAKAKIPPALSFEQWSAKGEVKFKDMTVDFGFGPRKFTGSINGLAGENNKPADKAKPKGKAKVKGKPKAGKRNNLYVDAKVSLESLQLNKHMMTAIRTRMKKAPGSNVIRMDEIVGKAHGGRMVGDATITLTEPIRYEMNGSVENIDLASLVNAGLPREKWSDVSGKLAGELALTITGGKIPVRQAAGDLEITKARMYKLPVILGLLNVIYLTVPGDSAFNGGCMRYHMKNDTLVFDEIFLAGKTISILGSGTLNMKTDAL
ncbi:MAG: hypothetical protein K8S55_11305, partial [Phycisphaerae bacterium]|nr:hypothetical protein [Phycisphaerae bacterium]